MRRGPTVFWRCLRVRLDELSVWLLQRKRLPTRELHGCLWNRRCRLPELRDGSDVSLGDVHGLQRHLVSRRVLPGRKLPGRNVDRCVRSRRRDLRGLRPHRRRHLQRWSLSVRRRRRLRLGSTVRRRSLRLQRGLVSFGLLQRQHLHLAEHVAVWDRGLGVCRLQLQRGSL